MRTGAPAPPGVYSTFTRPASMVDGRPAKGSRRGPVVLARVSPHARSTMPPKSSGPPPIRVRLANDVPLAQGRAFVLYWMIAARRVRYNYALDRAVFWARELGKPLVILEAL